MYGRIVVGTDGSERAAKAVEHAAALARLTGASVHLVQGCGSPVVVSPLGEGVILDPRETVAACTATLEQVAETLRSDGLDVDVHVRPTSGHAALCDVAESIDADVIVVGNRGMTGAGRVLGSVPNSVAHRAECAVLIVPTD